MAVLTEEKKFTVQEYLEWEGFEPSFIYELINGEIVKKTSPHPQHQIICANMFRHFDAFVQSQKLGLILFAPVDVFLDEHNALVPDLLFIAEARKSFLIDNSVEGAPDLVVEILSPSTAKYDRGDKLKVYRKHEVREYWLIDPKLKSVEVYVYRNGDYDLDFLETEKGTVQSSVLPGFVLSVEAIFN